MKLLPRWALVSVAASLLWLIAIIGGCHGRDTSVLHAAAATTGHFRAIRPGAGPVRLAAVTGTGAPPTTEVELVRGGHVEGTPAVQLASIADTAVDPPGPTDHDHWVLDIQQIYALKASTHRSVRDMRAPMGSGFATPECPERAYALAALDRVAEAGLADLLRLIPAQAEPLRAFVRSSYPTPSGVDVPYECFSRGGLVSSFVADHFLAEIAALHERFAREPAITIDLSIKSRPPGGSYVLRSIHTDVGKVENTTNSTARYIAVFMTFQ